MDDRADTPVPPGSDQPHPDPASFREPSHEPEREPPASQDEPPPLPPGAAPDELLTVPQVAERAGVHENTVRKHLKAGHLPFFLRDLATGGIMPGDAPQTAWPPRYQYLLPQEVVAHLASQTADRVASSPPPAAPSAATTSSEALASATSRLRADLSQAERELATTRDQLQDLRTERDWLRSHLRDITAFLPAAKHEAENVRSDLHQLQERAQRLEQDRERALHAARLEREARRLAAMRFRALSWWRRLRTDFEALVQDELATLDAADHPPDEPDPQP